jgi:phosphoserine phosphatase RsbU/P
MKRNTRQTTEQRAGGADELRKMRAEAEELRGQLNAARTALADLQQRFDASTVEIARERSERSQTEQALRLSELIVDRSPVILFRRAADNLTRLEYISNNLRQFGYFPEEFLAGDLSFGDIVHPDDRERIRAEIRQYAEADVEEYSQVYRCLTRSGEIRWVEDQTSVVRNDAGVKTHNQGILLDITKRKMAEDALRKSEEKFRRIVETAAEGFFLMDKNLVIIDVNNALCRMLGYTREEIVGKSPMELATDQFRQFMLLNRESLLAREYRESEGTVIARDGRLVPVLIHGNTLRDDQGQVIGNMAFITDMTEQKKALVLAAEVQKSLLPQDRPVVHGLDIAGRNISCDEIGGDYYDFFWRRDSNRGPISVVVGDITGHGVDSALLMTTARAFLRMRASQPGTLAEVVTAMNHHLALDTLQTGRFMTLFYLTIDPAKKRISWVRAGHEPALLYDPIADDFTELKGNGIALGVTDEFQFSENHRHGLTTGQIIAIGTDGIWEALNREGEMFGKDRLRAIIRHNSGDSAGKILGAVYDQLNLFTLGQKADDDITLVIIKVDEPEEQNGQS